MSPALHEPEVTAPPSQASRPRRRGLGCFDAHSSNAATPPTANRGRPFSKRYHHHEFIPPIRLHADHTQLVSPQSRAAALPFHRAFTFHLWDEVEDIDFARSGPGFRRLTSYTNAIELLRVTCPEQFRRHALAATFVEELVVENATAPTPPTGVKSQPPPIATAALPEPESVAVQEILVVPLPPSHEVQTEWAEINANLLAVETLEPRLEQPSPPVPEPTDCPTPVDANQPIDAEPAPTERLTPPGRRHAGGTAPCSAIGSVTRAVAGIPAEPDPRKSRTLDSDRPRRRALPDPGGVGPPPWRGGGPKIEQGTKSPCPTH